MASNIDPTSCTPPNLRYYELDEQNGSPPPPPPRVPPPEPHYYDETRGQVCNLAMQSVAFVQGARPGDVRQGRLPDCTFMAMLASCSRTREGEDVLRNRIDIIRDAAGNEVSYRVHVFAHSLRGYEPYTVNLDACHLQAKGFMGADNAGGHTELWPRLLEAAMFRLMEGRSLTTTEAFGLLMGRDPITCTTDRADLAAKLALDFHAGKVQTLVTSPAFAEIYVPEQLRGNHAYTVTNVFEQGGVTHVQLRDPWGDNLITLPINVVQQYFKGYCEGSVS